MTTWVDKAVKFLTSVPPDDGASWVKRFRHRRLPSENARILLEKREAFLCMPWDARSMALRHAICLYHVDAAQPLYMHTPRSGAAFTFDAAVDAAVEREMRSRLDCAASEPVMVDRKAWYDVYKKDEEAVPDDDLFGLKKEDLDLHPAKAAELYPAAVKNWVRRAEFSVRLLGEHTYLFDELNRSPLGVIREWTGERMRGDDSTPSAEEAVYRLWDDHDTHWNVVTQTKNDPKLKDEWTKVNSDIRHAPLPKPRIIIGYEPFHPRLVTSEFYDDIVSAFLDWELHEKLWAQRRVVHAKCVRAHREHIN